MQDDKKWLEDINDDMICEVCGHKNKNCTCKTQRTNNIIMTIGVILLVLAFLALEFLV